MESAAILAGGQATRFGGRDKSALLIDGRSEHAHAGGNLGRLGDVLLGDQ